MTHSQAITALMDAQPLFADSEEGATAPDWIHLLPASSGQIHTVDGRGPYNLDSGQRVVDLFYAQGEDLLIDEDHAVDRTRNAPASGWITGMEARPDGVWGKVKWTKRGRELVETQAYRRISPVIALPFQGSKDITQILRASLVNRPNLVGLTALNDATQQQEPEMDFLAKLRKAAGLGADASEDDVLAAITKMAGAKKETPALQSAMTQIGVALGLPEASDADAILTAAQSAGQAKDAVIAELQSQVVELSANTNAMIETGKRTAAEAFVDGAIRERRAGLGPASREHFISMHMADPQGAETTIGMMPKLGETGMTIAPPAAKEGEISLNAAQAEAARVLGIDPKAYAATLAAETNGGAV